MTRSEFEKIAKPKIKQWLLDRTKDPEYSGQKFFPYSYKYKDHYFTFVYLIGKNETLDETINKVFDRVCSFLERSEDGYELLQVFDYGELWKYKNKQTKHMKNLTWQQWTAIGVTAAVVVAGVVLHFVQPEVSYAFTEAMTAGGFIVGGLVGYLLKKNNIVKQ